MTASTYKQVWDGDWITLPKTGLQLACCDCYLTHDIDLRIRKGKIEVRFNRNNRITGQLRRHVAKTDAPHRGRKGAQRDE